MSLSQYALGLALETMVNLDTVVNMHLPRGTFKLYPVSYVGGDSRTVGDGLPVVIWHFDVLTQAELNALRLYTVPGGALLESTANLVTNPSLETNVNGYSAVYDAAIGRLTELHKFGNYTLYITPTSSLNDGALYALGELTDGLDYALSWYVYGTAGVPYVLYITNGGGTHMSSLIQFEGANAFERQSLVYTPEATEELYAVLRKDEDASEAWFFADGLQLEQKDHVTAYCDGDQAFCRWMGTQHASISTRPTLTYQLSNEIYITTRLDNGAFATFCAMMHWDEDAEKKRIPASGGGIYQDIEITFTAPIQVIE